MKRHGDIEVTYAIFMRRPVLSAPTLALRWLEDMMAHRGAKIDIDLRHPEGSWVGAGQAICYITGSLANLVDLETIFLQRIGAHRWRRITRKPCANLCRKWNFWRWMRAIVLARIWRN